MTDQSNTVRLGDLRLRSLGFLTRLGLSFGVLVLLGGVAFFVGTRDDGPRHPEAWDARVLELVQFAEKERGLTFEADLVHGQKTGHFLDQRDNRFRVRSRAAGVLRRLPLKSWWWPTIAVMKRYGSWSPCTEAKAGVTSR